MEGPRLTIFSVALCHPGQPEEAGPRLLLPVSSQNEEAQWNLEASFPQAYIQSRCITTRLTKTRTNSFMFSLACLLDLFQEGETVGKWLTLDKSHHDTSEPGHLGPSVCNLKRSFLLEESTVSV